MTRNLLVMILLSLAGLVPGCSSASAACPGGNCSVGVWSPWGGAWYYASPCSGGKYRTAARPKTDENAEQKADATAEPGAENCQPGSGPDLVSIPAAEADTLDFAPFCVRVAELINAQRAALGLAPLVLDQALCDGCGRHCSWMANGGGFRHAYYAGARECIAMGVRTPEAVVNMWLGSSGHRAIILGGGRILGVGCSGSYWTLRVK